MATQLDLQEQEQLDALKAFWNKQGNLITWVLILALAAYAGWNGWRYWQRDQAQKAGALYEELDKAATAGDADKVTRVFNDLKSRHPDTAYAAQGALLAAKVQLAKNQTDAAKASLGWVAAQAKHEELRSLAQLRLAGVQFDSQQYAEALKTLASVQGEGFTALAADRQGDVLAAQGKSDEARAAYQRAWQAMGDKVDYRRLVEAKLVALGAPPVAPAAAASGAAK